MRPRVEHQRAAGGQATVRGRHRGEMAFSRAQRASSARRRALSSAAWRLASSTSLRARASPSFSTFSLFALPRPPSSLDFLHSNLCRHALGFVDRQGLLVLAVQRVRKHVEAERRGGVGPSTFFLSQCWCFRFGLLSHCIVRVCLATDFCPSSLIAALPRIPHLTQLSRRPCVSLRDGR